MPGRNGRNHGRHTALPHPSAHALVVAGAVEEARHDDDARLRLQHQGRLNLNQLVSARYPLEQINTAMDAMRDGRTAGRVLIEL